MFTDKELEIITKESIKAALKASFIIKNKFKCNHKILIKKSASSLASNILTEVDLKSQKIILDILRPICKKFDIAILSEEIQDNKDRFQKKYFFCIDPLDGTLPFTKGKHGFSVSISLVSKNHIPIIGIVADPITGNLYHAIKDKYFLKNFKTMLKKSFLSKDLTIITEESTKNNPKFNDFKYQLTNKSKSEIKFSSSGAVMNAIKVLENKASAYIKLPKPQKGGGSLWDFAATTCIFNQNNYFVSDFSGKKLKLNKKNTTFMNKEGIIFTKDKATLKKLINAYKEII